MGHRRSTQQGYHLFVKENNDDSWIDLGYFANRIDVNNMILSHVDGTGYSCYYKIIYNGEIERGRQRN